MVTANSWSAARDLGVNKFFTGKPCSRGHITERYYPSGRCLACTVEDTRRWNKNNPSKVSARWKKYHSEKRDAICDRKREYERENIDAVRQRKREYMKKNHHRFKRKLNLITPKCLLAEDHAAIDAMYEKARQLTAETGEAHEVDHMVPIKGANVCGLHVPWNLQVITRFVNRSKHNRYDEHAAR